MIDKFETESADCTFEFKNGIFYMTTDNGNELDEYEIDAERIRRYCHIRTGNRIELVSNYLLANELADEPEDVALMLGECIAYELFDLDAFELAVVVNK